MQNQTKKTKEKKPHRVRRIILRILGVLLLILIATVAVLSVRHRIKSPPERESVTGAYGTFYTTENGDKLNYTFYDSDAEKIAVILPGFGCPSPHYEFDTFAKELHDDYKIVIAEPLGYGLSDETDVPRTVENYSTELHGLMQSLGYDRYTIICHSIGGLYMPYYTNQYPDEVEAFIGIDASVPHQLDSGGWINEKDHMYQLYKGIRIGLVNTGIYRLMTELSFDATTQPIPTLTDADKAKYLALYNTVSCNDTQLDEIRRMPNNAAKGYDLKYPESVPVLYVLAKTNCDTDPMWEQYHKDLATTPGSKVAVIEGDHYLHFTSLQELLKQIRDWEY